MKAFLWHFGKLLQLLGLVVAPYALYVGFSTTDATLELKLLLSAVGLFVVGYAFIRVGSSA